MIWRPPGSTRTVNLCPYPTLFRSAWGAADIANMNGITTRLRWTDQHYKWHINDGEDVFAVLSGRVEMRYKEAGIESSTILETGDVFYAAVGTEHVAHTIGEARILVVEHEGSG